MWVKLLFNIPVAHYDFIILFPEKAEIMVMCTNLSCRPSWLHLSCIGLNQETDPSEDWYCSDECSETGSYLYCFCHVRKPAANMVQCGRQEGCYFHEWYHHHCLNVADDHEFEGTSYKIYSHCMCVCVCIYVWNISGLKLTWVWWSVAVIKLKYSSLTHDCWWHAIGYGGVEKKNSCSIRYEC